VGHASHRSNPYAASLLLGKSLVEPNAADFPIQFVCADAADFLEGRLPVALEGFSRFNIGDGASPDYLRRVRIAVDHAAAPNAIVVARSFSEPGKSLE
jgi:hypothetical protein